MITKAGRYYGRTHDGRLLEVGAGKPDDVICRRVADFPNGPPFTALIVPCRLCSSPVARNPKGPYQDKPAVCMQCCDIEPLPFETRQKST